MTTTKEQAQKQSLVKWDKIKEDLNMVFYDVNMPCGYCIYGNERTEHLNFEHKCKSCSGEFPKVARICREMVDFFSAKHGELDKMIDAIIKTITAEKS